LIWVCTLIVFQDDVHFLLDCLDTIDLQCVSKLSDLSSRQTFSWATSNLCDALAKYHSSSEDPSLGWGTYFKIYHLVIRLAQDNTKVSKIQIQSNLREKVFVVFHIWHSHSCATMRIGLWER